MGLIQKLQSKKGKKFMVKQFNQLLMSIQSKTMSQQYTMIENSLAEWKSDLQQVDDILVIGIRIYESETIQKLLNKE